MSRDNDSENQNWGEEYEDEEPRSFRDAYLDALHQNRPRPDTSQPGRKSSGAPGRGGSTPRSRAGAEPGGLTSASKRPVTRRENSGNTPSEIARSPRPPATRSPRRGESDYDQYQPPRSPAARGPRRLESEDQPPRSPRPPASRSPRPGANEYDQYQPPRSPRPPVNQGPRRTQSEYDEYESPRPARIKSSSNARRREDDYNEYDEYEQERPVRSASSRNTRRMEREMSEYDEQQEVSAPGRSYTEPHHHHRHRRHRRAGANIFYGCLGGVITLAVVGGVLLFLFLHNTPVGQNIGVTRSNYSQPQQQTLALDNVTQLIVRNQLGNIKITVNQDAQTATLYSEKKVQATSQSDANSLFNQISFAVTPLVQGADPDCRASNCLLISTKVPPPTGGLFGGQNTSIDLTITLPGSFNPSDPTSPNTITTNNSAGDTTVDGFNGILQLAGTAGNIHVTRSLIYAGTCLQTMNGDINVDQQSNFATSNPSNLVPCSNKTSTDDHFWFSLSSGKGDVNVTFTTASTSLKLDASVNQGEVNSDFNPNPTAKDSYQGPLVPGTTPEPTASIKLFASTGNIVIHKG